MKKRTIPFMIVMTLILSFCISSMDMSHAAANQLVQDNPNQVQMLEEPLADIDQAIEEAISEQVMPGAVVLVAKNGKIVKHNAYGYAARYTDADFTEMENPVMMQEDTIFDMASISKLFTATAVMQLWDQGIFELDDPVAEYIPEFAVNEKEEVTIRQLLTHTSGFAPSPSESLYLIEGDREDRLDFVLEEPLENQPNTEYVYSDVNYLTLGVLVERLSGVRQDAFVSEYITEPLDMEDTMYNPPASLRDRIAATEYQPWTERGLVWGSVHDENAWSLDGVAGQAGIFSTATDLAAFAQMMLQDGNYKGEQILSDKAVELMKTNWNEAFPGQDQGLGWELNQSWYMDDLAEVNTMGHTGYTGTSIVVSPNQNSLAVLLTNRVHPTRETVSTNPIRREVSEQTAAAIHSWSAEQMNEMVEILKTKDAFATNRAAYSLQLHLTAVSRYEKLDKSDKVIKHLKGFQQLIDEQLNQEMITEEAYTTLANNTAYLQNKWQN
ncbi:serine hydrolase domain-containing protein [Virgibacillus salexigens]|uniref:Serine hydrolase n=1 Tax=Virgibacillus kapii TaxID=1638645 RepID=A0ABQ2DKF9_9BACI|nr:serine hydrolase domain-containing protein [Virgibacillus kapii]GGJ60244.1 hypothetical protein GCM10007111_22870 [Virgibacillus kapii]